MQKVANTYIQILLSHDFIARHHDITFNLQLQNINDAFWNGKRKFGKMKKGTFLMPLPN